MPINKEFLIEAFQKKYELNIFVEDVVRRVFGQEVEIYTTPEKHELKTEQEKKIIEKTIKYGHLELADESGSKLFATDKLDFYEVILKPSVRLEQNRVTIQQFVRSLLVPGHAALINFVSPHKNDKWRLSLVSKDSEITSKGIQEYSTHAKRFTFLIEKNRQNSTAAIRLSDLSRVNAFTIKNITEAFSVESLSKAFFDEYKYHYEEKFLPYFIKNKNLFKQPDNVDKEKLIRDYTKKLLGRIVFLYFVQKKGWLGASSIEYKDGDENFIINLFNSSKSGDAFYQTWLRKLFFETLNDNQTAKRKKEEFDLPDGTTVYVPFLNGGLFDPEEVDKNIITVKAKLFHTEDIKVSETPNERGFLDFLNSYNFTIYEDDPESQTIAVDPEMLGHIFENLLEDNKDKGTFYTPKQIVHYMCQESLIEYLCTRLQADESKRRDLELLIKNPALCRELNKFRYEADYVPVMEALKNVKICDPAIGSGAFPMGMLLEIYRLVEQFSFERDAISVWKINDWEREKHKVKLNIIQNSIYGVDIEKGAVDIARLRFWLSLIVDLEMPEALPNLDYKIVEGNSLVSEFHVNSKDKFNVEIDWEVANKTGTDSTKKHFEKIADGLKKLNSLQQKYFTAQGDKKSIQKEIRLLKIEILQSQIELDKIIYEIKSREQGQLFDENKADKQKELDIKLKLAGYNEALKHLKELKSNSDKQLRFFNYELDFAEVMNVNICKNPGFDIVIGNPPYGAKFNDSEKALFRKLYPETQFKIDSYSLFLLKSIPLLKSDGINYFIIPNTFLDNYFEEKVRFKLLKNHSIYEILDLSDCVFETAVVHSMIFSFRKSANPTYNIKINADNNLLGEKKLIPNEFFLKQDKYLISIRNYDSKDLFEKLNINSVALEGVLDIRQTIKTGDDKRYIVDKAKGKNYKPILRGKDVHKYEKKFSNLYVGYGSHLACPRDPKIFEQPKILIREAGAEITATFDDENYYIMSSLYNGIQIDKSYDLKYLLALLNSKLFQYQMNKLTFEKTKGAFTKARIFHYYKLPIKRLKDQSAFIKLIDKILKLKTQRKQSQNEENELDFMIYKLYDLNYDEALVVDEGLSDIISQDKFDALKYQFTFLPLTGLSENVKSLKKSKKNLSGLNEINFD